MAHALLLLIFSAVACAADKPAFDVADVHMSARANWSKTVDHAMQGGYLMGDRYDIRHATLLDLIKTAYNIDAGRIYGGPSWIDYDRYDIAAKTKPDTRAEALRLMLQTLLEDRFKLAVKLETRDVPAYILSKGKGELKVKEGAAGAPPGSCGQILRVSDSVSNSKLQCKNASMTALAQNLRRLVAGISNTVPVVDSTGLEGFWDVDLDVPNPAPGTGTASAAILEEINKLGLKFELGRVPQEVMEVAGANETPSPNPPDIGKIPPMPVPEFEVAAVKWPCGDSRGSFAPRFETGGRVTATCMPLLSLIQRAWGLNGDEKPVGLPKWLEDSGTKYNVTIAAKAPDGIAPDPQHNAQAGDLLNQMLQKLLIDRYQMKVHYEDRQMDAPTLVAVKPKLTKSEGNRTGCERQQSQPQGRSVIVTLACKNMTMAQWAEQIKVYDIDLIYPVVDSTGVEGSFDFTLTYDAFAGLNARFPAVNRGGPDGQAADPSGALSFAGALEKQLGLKLEMRKRSVPVLVIDRMEEKPIEN
jgi:uncharacterized protein (TIGR03435 family)